MRYSKRHILLLLISIISEFSLSQTDTTNLFSHQNELITGFEKNVNTYKWIGNISYNLIQNNYDIRIENQFRSNLIKTKSNLYRDENSGEVFGKYKISEPLKVYLRLNTLIISDNLETGLSKIGNHLLLCGVGYLPTENFSIEPMVGFRSDKQYNKSDFGPALYFRLFSPNIELQGYNNYIEVIYQRENLTPRYFETQNIVFNNHKIFSDNTYNILNFKFKKFSRDFYVLSDTEIQDKYTILSNIEKRSERILSLYDSLNYNINRLFNILAAGYIYYRNINKQIKYKTPNQFDNQISDFKISGYSKFTVKFTKNVLGNFDISYTERNVTHELSYTKDANEILFENLNKVEMQKNNYSRQTTLSGNMLFNFTDNDLISLSASGSILRYDTPSEANDDDRDELWQSYNITSYNKINKYLKMSIALDANLVHIIYLLGTRSVSNNWNRIIKLSPKIDFIPSEYFSTTNAIEVIANYTTYDFENENFPLKSYVFRQFSFYDSTQIKLSRRLFLTFQGKLLLYERGELNWSAFKARPVNFFEDRTIIFRTYYKRDKNLLFTFGIRYFSQKRFRYEFKNKIIETLLTSIGPTASIELSIGQRLLLTINGWSEKIKYTNSQPRISTNMFINLAKSL